MIQIEGFIAICQNTSNVNDGGQVFVLYWQSFVHNWTQASEEQDDHQDEEHDNQLDLEQYDEQDLEHINI